MTEEHVVGGIVADDPAGLASAIVKRPGMYLGGPVPFERRRSPWASRWP